MSSWIADYRIVRPLGDGDGESNALLARAPARLGGTEVVLHLLEPGGPPGSSVRLTAASTHLLAVAGACAAHVAGLIEMGQGDRDGKVTAYVATEYRGDGSLVDAASLDPHTVLSALAGAARGAHELHEAGLAHGDIRPATILVTPAGGALTAPLPPGTTEPGRTAMADPPKRLETVDPAVLRGDKPSRASDVWALGAAAHRAVTGRSLHPQLETDDPLTAARRALLEPPVIDPGLSPDRSELIAGCVHPDPGRRPVSAAAVADAFDALARA